MIIFSFYFHHFNQSSHLYIYLIFFINLSTRVEHICFKLNIKLCLLNIVSPHLFILFNKKNSWHKDDIARYHLISWIYSYTHILTRLTEYLVYSILLQSNLPLISVFVFTNHELSTTSKQSTPLLQHIKCIIKHI